MFASEVHRLSWLIDEVEHRLDDAEIQNLRPGGLKEFVVCSCWMDTFVVGAKSIRSLLSDEQYNGTGPLERAMWELWINWKYFFGLPDREHAAAKVMLTAELEAIEFAQSRESEFSAEAMSGIRRSIATAMKETPEILEELREQRRKRRFHWSGKTISAIEREIMPAPGVYKTLSWEAHAVLGPIRDLKIDLSDGRAHFQFGRREGDLFANPERIAYSTSGVLFFTYADYAHRWGLAPIHQPADSSA